jgi:endonuclease/exonuclease/phosphatase family metal-dependent hydrolase
VVLAIRLEMFAVLVACYAAVGTATLSQPLRVLTYNIHHGEGTDGVIDLARVATVINGAQPDVVALQEVDNGTGRTGRVQQLAQLEQLTGMRGAFGKAMDYDGGEYGVGVLARRPIVRIDNRTLAQGSGHEPRTSLTVYVEMGAGKPLLRFTSTHLDNGLEVSARVRQALELNAGPGAEDRAPRILAGDMNSRAGSEVLEILSQQWTEASIPPGPLDAQGRPLRRVDYVFVSPASSWRVVDSQVLDDRLASDHRPVLAVVEWLGTR